MVLVKIAFCVACFFVALKIWQLFLSVLHRLFFVVKIRRKAKKKGGNVKTLHSPLSSFFKKYDGEDLLIEIPNEKAIKIKFFPGWVKSKNVLLQNACFAIIQRNLFLFTQRQARFSTTPTRYVSFSGDIGHRQKRYSSVFSDYEGTNVLMFSPAPISLTGVENNKSIVLDGGAPIYGMVVYSTKVFLEKMGR